MRLLLEHGRRVADEYRSNDIPRTREGDWERARRYMTYARRLDASDKKAAAMFEYADGHILRINKKDAEAVSAFRRAASLDPRWPDPHLGMARAYIYGLKDFESGVRALERAEDLGHTPGKRELLQRADALKNKAIEYWQGAAQLRGQPQEEELLAKAKDDLERALEIYARIAPWGDSAPQVKSVQAMLDKIESRLEVIDPPESILPWEWWKRMKKK
jgi:tetratricopeptide (TPR) repeat protein